MKISKMLLPLLALTLTIFLNACGSSNTATGYWQSPSTSSGSYIWLRLNEYNSTITGSFGTSSSTGSLSLNGSRTGNNLSVHYASLSASFDFEGPISGDNFTALTTVCQTTCSSGTIVFRRTSASSNSVATSARSTTEPEILEAIQSHLK